jgi:hypothetical protein
MYDLGIAILCGTNAKVAKHNVIVHRLISTHVTDNQQLIYLIQII